MKQLVYISKATISFDSESLQKLTELASSNNKKIDVTGCMLYASGYFLQMLEGENAAVDTLYKKIELDKRHMAVKTLIEKELVDSRRMYDKWFMTSFNVDKMIDFPEDLKKSINETINDQNSLLPVHRIFMEFTKYLARRF